MMSRGYTWAYMQNHLSNGIVHKHGLERAVLMQSKCYTPLSISEKKENFLNFEQPRGKPTMWFPNRSDTNRPVQQQNQARSLKFWN